MTYTSNKEFDKNAIQQAGFWKNRSTGEAAVNVEGDMQIVDVNGRALVLESNNSLPVTLQDQHTPAVLIHMSILEESTTTTGAVALGDYIIPVTSATGISTGKMLVLFDPDSIRFTMFHVVSIIDLNVTVDRPMDFAYPTGSYVDISETNLAVNGSSTPVVAGVRNNAGAIPPPGIDLDIDITRLMFSCTASSAISFDLFGNIAALTNGIVLRKRDGTYHNIASLKSNKDIVGIMFDFTPYAATNPQQGVDGFVARFTFAGQDKLGIVQRLAINEDLELIIQDNLTGITSLEIMAEGSVVQD